VPYPTCDIDADYHRLIPTRLPPVPLYSRLGPPEVQAAAEACEAKTNPRLQALERLAQEGPAAAGGARAQNWNLAPFSYPNPEGTTFLDPSHKVLELVAGVRAALAVAVQRREAFLGGSGEPALQVEMRALVHKVHGRFLDLTGVPYEPDRDKRWAFGARLYREAPDDVQGIVFLRPDLGGARGIIVFDGGALGTAVQSDHYRFLWDGEEVGRIGNFSTDEVIDRAALFASLGGKAAA
jgi:hypothetical protein